MQLLLYVYLMSIPDRAVGSFESMRGVIFPTPLSPLIRIRLTYLPYRTVWASCLPGAQCARIGIGVNPRFEIWWCQMIVSYPNRTARWVSFHFWSYKKKFCFFEKLEFLPFFQKKSLFYLINQCLNLSSSWIGIQFHQKSLIPNISLLLADIWY